MDKALSPYIMGGGAKTYERELRKTYGIDEEGMGGAAGGFQAMTTVRNCKERNNFIKNIFN